MAHPNLYNDNIAGQKHTRHGTFIHVSDSRGHAIIQTHDAKGKLLAGEENTTNPRREVVATGQQKHVEKKFKELGPAVPLPSQNEEYEEELTNEEHEEMYEEKNEEKNEINSMLESILSDELVESKDTFASIISNKIAMKLEEVKIKVAMSLIGESKADDLWSSAEDKHEKANRLNKDAPKKESEVDDNAWNSHPLKQLRNITDHRVLSPEENLEYTASGAVDKRSLDAYNKRKAGLGTSDNSGIHSGLPTLKHLNGEESKVSQEEAHHLIHALTHPNIKPETKKAAWAKLHASKKGLSKIQAAVGTGVVKNTSIYQDPRVGVD